ncbi:hypothetical protein AB0467_02500 [Streptomyces sp. NPDC052095]|uniref:hypothetical protein n=1 Tax=unclassified Streptomyces TaxID=2593676 RepID=UPI00344DF9A5
MHPYDTDSPADRPAWYTTALLHDLVPDDLVPGDLVPEVPDQAGFPVGPPAPPGSVPVAPNDVHSPPGSLPTGPEPDSRPAPLPDTGPAPARHVPSGHAPRIALPRTLVDCITLDSLRDHPSVDPFVLAQLDAGASFRILRFPFSLRQAAGGTVRELSFSVRLDSACERTAPPRVHSIHPVREENRDTVVRETALSPTLSIGSAVDIGVGRVGRTVTAQRSRALVVGFWSEDGADWILRAPDDRGAGLDGTWEFLTVVRWDGPAARLRAELSVTARLNVRRQLRRTRRIEHVYGPFELTGCQDIV